MEKIESLEPKAFSEYQNEFQNTICGRHPIAVLLHVSVLVVLITASQPLWQDGVVGGIPPIHPFHSFNIILSTRLLFSFLGYFAQVYNYVYVCFGFLNRLL